MKKILTVGVFILLTHFSYSQKLSKEDSLLQIEQRKFVDSLTRTTSMQTFLLFLDENVPAKKFREIDQLWGAFLNQRYQEYLATKQKPKKQYP